MKKSYYNFLFSEENDKTILYNSRTGAMAELDAEHTEQFKNWSEEELEYKAPEFATALFENGFAVADGVSELDMIRYDMLRARFGNQSLSLTLAITQDCNFRCKYCYEKDVLKKKYMDEKTKQAIVKYVDEHVIMGGSLHITWYGGEPLLDVRTIQWLTEMFLKICSEKQIEYSADIVTNGYLLTQEVAKILVDCKIEQIQVTLDGDEKTHNKRRPLENDNSSYQTIWNNILSLNMFRNDIKIALRVNIDKNNENALYDVKNKILKHEMEDFIYVYPGRVLTIESCHNSGVCYSNKEFAILEQKYYCNDLKNEVRNFPKPRSIVCSADNAHAMVIDSNGDMYKCYLHIGDETRCIGNVVNDRFYHEGELYKYLLHDVTNDINCTKCKYLPICMGGCLDAYLKNSESCTRYKYTIDKYIKYCANSMKTNKLGPIIK